MRRLASTVSLALAVVFVLPAAAGELAGVTMSDKVSVGDHELVLNGMGLRKKFIIKVYVAGLYLPAKQANGERVLAADTARRTVMHFLYGVDKGKICEAWNDSLAANTPDASEAVRASFVDLCDAMEDMEKGERMTFTYVPGKGTTIDVGGKAKQTIAGKPFADALWASWIGEVPATGDLRDGMLGE